jgi:hypothetical protein
MGGRRAIAAKSLNGSIATEPSAPVLADVRYAPNCGHLAAGLRNLLSAEADQN